MRMSKQVAVLSTIVWVWLIVGCASSTEMPSYVRPSSTPPVSVPPSVTDFAPTVLPVNWTEEKVSLPVLGAVQFSEDAGKFKKGGSIYIYDSEEKAKAQAAKEYADLFTGIVVWNAGFIRCGSVVFEVYGIVAEDKPEDVRTEARKYAVDSMAAAAPGMAALGECETTPVK